MHHKYNIPGRTQWFLRGKPKLECPWPWRRSRPSVFAAGCNPCSVLATILLRTYQQLTIGTWDHTCLFCRPDRKQLGPRTRWNCLGWFGCLFALGGLVGHQFRQSNSQNCPRNSMLKAGTINSKTRVEICEWAVPVLCRIALLIFGGGSRWGRCGRGWRGRQLHLGVFAAVNLLVSSVDTRLNSSGPR